MSRQKNIKTNIIVHADRVEVLLPASRNNCDVLSTQFHSLIAHWKSAYGLASRAKKRWSHTGRFIFWELELWNQDIRITLKDCPALHIQDTGKPLKQEPDWLKHPFPTSEQLYEHYSTVDIAYLGVLRITCKDKTDPYKYTWYLWKILTDLETWGIGHKSRLLEIAMDIYDRDLADLLRRTARLAGHKSPLDLGYGVKGGMCDGASHDGNNEYEHCRKFIRDRTRQVHCYQRWETGFYRIELILGEVYLHRYYGTKAFYKDLENSGGRYRANPQFCIGTDRPQPLFNSPTIPLLDAIAAILKRHLVFEQPSVGQIIEEHPRLSTLNLDRLSIRGVRYYLERAQIPLHTHITRLPFPKYQSISPADVEALDLEASLNKCEIDNEVDYTVDTYTAKEIILYPKQSLVKPVPVLQSERFPTRSRSP